MIDLIAGTRPELVKIAPIIKNLKKSQFNLVFTGQHFDYGMSLRFMEELEIKADLSTRLVSSDQIGQTTEMMKFLANNFKMNNTRYAVVIGDTNSAFVGAFSALRMGVEPIHVEAGLRSYDWRMAEEYNRVMCDHISAILCAPTIGNKNTLQKEHVHGEIHVTGNTVIDAVEQNIAKAMKKYTIDIPSKYILLTMHRAENVDNEQTLRTIVKAITRLKETIVFPAHPRTLKRLKEFGLYDKIASCKNIKLIDPVGYFDFLVLMKKSDLVITDSGGVQEECTSPAISKHVIIMRISTERTESIKMGYAVISALHEESIVRTVKAKLNDEKLVIRKSPYGDGKAGEKIAKLLLSRL